MHEPPTSPKPPLEGELEEDAVTEAVEAFLSSNDLIYEDEDEVTICPRAEALSRMETSVPCPVPSCGVTVSNGSALSLHVKKFHKIPVRTDAEKFAGKTWSYACPVSGCAYAVDAARRFAQRKHVKQHYLKVHAEKTHKCPHCSATFGYVHALTEHRQSCGSVYRCGECPKQFRKVISLTTHSAETGHSFDENQAPSLTKAAMDRLRSRRAEIEERKPEVNETQTVFIILSNNPPPRPVLDSATSPRRDGASSSCDAVSVSVGGGDEDDDFRGDGVVSVVDPSVTTALFAAHALVDLSVSPFFKPPPSRTEVAVQTDGGGGGRRRSSPGRSGAAPGGRKRSAEVQTRLTVKSNRKVKHSVAQTTTTPPGTSKRARKSPSSSSLPVASPPTPPPLPPALVVERTESPSINCVLDLGDVRAESEPVPAFEPPFPSTPAASVGAPSSVVHRGGGDGLSSLQSVGVETDFSREIQTQTELDLSAFLSECAVDFENMLSSATQTFGEDLDLDQFDFVGNEESFGAATVTAVDSNSGGDEDSGPANGTELLDFVEPRDFQTQTSWPGQDGLDEFRLPFEDAADDDDT